LQTTFLAGLRFAPAGAVAEAWKIAEGQEALRNVPPGSINKLVGEGWNAGGTDAKGGQYAVFDLGRGVHIVGFAIYSVGDVTHDPDEIQIQTSAQASGGGKWTTVATVHGGAGDDGLQEFGGFSATSRYWRLYIASTHKPQYHQAMVKEVYFKPHPNSTVPTLDSVLQQAADRHAAGATNNIPSEILVYYQPYNIGDCTSPQISTRS